MGKIKRKVFILELKRTLFLPALFFGFYLLMELFDFLSFFDRSVLTGGLMRGLDRRAEICQYIFFALLVLSFGYRTFADRKTYAQVRVNPESLFGIRLLLIFASCTLYTTVSLLLGTARMALFEGADYLAYLKFDGVCTFAMQGKNAWYLLFGAANGMSAAILYAVIVYIENALFSNAHWSLKILWIFLMAGVFLVSFIVAKNTADVCLFGENEMFVYSLPMDPITYNVYLHYLPENNTAIVSYITWSISNVYSLVCGLLTIVFSFLSITVLPHKLNSDYGYSRKTKRQTGGENNEEDQ